MNPERLRQLILLTVAIPVVLGWCVSVAVWAVNGDVAGLTVTTPLMLGLLAFATGVSVTRNGKGRE